MDNHINNLFQACTPKEEQRDRILRGIEKDSPAKAYKRTGYSIHHWIRPMVACALGALLILGALSFVGDRTAFSVYAYGSDTEITAAGVELSTGVIQDDGEMKGQLLRLIVQGENIDTIRYSCKNQYLDFTDWTESRPNYSMEKQFEVSYGTKAADYNYLVVHWNPINTIRKLTDHADTTIANLDKELRNDIIVMEVTFTDGSTVTKAIEITIQDNGKIFAKLRDYVVTEDDDFILEPQPKASSQAAADNDEHLQANQVKYSEMELEVAKAVAEEYYSGFSGDHEIIAIDYSEESHLLSDGVADEYKEWQIIAFTAREKSNDPHTARTILLARENSRKDWIVINEGY